MTHAGKLHVLIAEDTQAIALPMLAALEQTGHRVTHVTSGEGAVAAFERETPDLVLMDIVMPGMGGIEATRRIRAIRVDHWVPIIMTTQLSTDEDLVAGIEAGADDYLIKPVSPAVLKARMRSMQRIAAIQRSLDSIIDNIIEGIILIDREGRIIKFNRAAEAMFGYPTREVIGRNISMLMPAPYCDEHDRYLQRYLQTGEAHSVGKPRRVTGRRRNGEVFPMYLGVTEVMMPEGENFIGLVRDLTQEEAMQARIEHLAWHDALTGLANRASLWQTLETWLATSAPFALLFLDLDGFKMVNDAYGHTTGDEVLSAAAERLRRAVAATDVVGRFGGDEFVVLLAGIDDDAQAFAVANRLIVELSHPIIVDDHPHGIGVSIGIVMRRASDAYAKKLVRAADAAMYRAKQAGRNRAVLARPKN